MALIYSSPTFSVIMLITSILSSIVSFVMMLLILDLGQPNGCMLLIWCMTWSQFIYDISFYPGVVTIPSYTLTVLANIFQLIGGIGVSIFSNIMTIVVLTVIIKRKSVDIRKQYKYYLVIVWIPIVVEVLLYILSAGDSEYTYLSDIALNYIYYYFRLASIFFNFLACGFSYLYVRRMGISPFRKNHKGNLAMSAIYILSSRMQLYPIMQAISRSGCAWYEAVYGFEFDPGYVTTTQFAAQIYLALVTPTASIAYFVIFLVMQPKAYRQLLWRLGCGSNPEERNDAKKFGIASEAPPASFSSRSTMGNPLHASDNCRLSDVTAPKISSYKFSKNYSSSSPNSNSKVSSQFSKFSSELDVGSRKLPSPSIFEMLDQTSTGFDHLGILNEMGDNELTYVIDNFPVNPERSSWWGYETSFISGVRSSSELSSQESGKAIEISNTNKLNKSFSNDSFDAADKPTLLSPED